MADPAPQSNPMPWWVLPGLAAMILVIYAGSLTVVCTLVQNDTLRTSMLGSVPVVVMAAINYFFGSSAGSDKKSDVIASDSANKSVALAASTPTTPTVPPAIVQATQDITDAAAAAEALKLKTAGAAL